MPVNNPEADQGSREHILSVAAQLFLERGFANVSIREICERAEVTPPTIYHYFGSKDRLFQAVIRSTLSLRGFRESLVKAMEDQNDPEGQLCAFINHYILSFPRDFFNPGLFLQYSTQVFGVSAEHVMVEFQAIDELATRMIKEGIRTGAFRDADPDQATLYLMNLLMAYVLGEVHFDQPHDPDSTVPFIFDMFVNGMRRQG